MDESQHLASAVLLLAQLLTGATSKRSDRFDQVR